MLRNYNTTFLLCQNSPCRAPLMFNRLINSKTAKKAKTGTLEAREIIKYLKLGKLSTPDEQ